jgi:hypothetical protein
LLPPAAGQHLLILKLYRATAAAAECSFVCSAWQQIV